MVLVSTMTSTAVSPRVCVWSSVPTLLLRRLVIPLGHASVVGSVASSLPLVWTATSALIGSLGSLLTFSLFFSRRLSSDERSKEISQSGKGPVLEVFKRNVVLVLAN